MVHALWQATPEGGGAWEKVLKVSKRRKAEDLFIRQAAKQFCELLGQILRFTKDSDLVLDLSETLTFFFPVEGLMLELCTKYPSLSNIL